MPLLYAMLIPLGILTSLGLLFGLALAIGPWRNPQTREERRRALESGACGHCSFSGVCHMDLEVEDSAPCDKFQEEEQENG